jgi:hypothetical protein
VIHVAHELIELQQDLASIAQETHQLQVKVKAMIAKQRKSEQQGKASSAYVVDASGQAQIRVD